jgi:LacI family transcriptional regulator
MATMQEIAKKAGVSQATVSRVINKSPSVSIETRQNVMKWVKKLNYQPNLTAQSLVRKQSYLLGIVLPEISNPYFSDVLKIVEQEASLNGYNLIFCHSGDNLQKEKHAINTLRGRQVDGLLLVPVDPESAHLNVLRQHNVPVVTITREVAGFDSVSISHCHGGALVAKHLLETGHTHIGYIGPTHEEKFQGFLEEFTKNGIRFSDEHIIELEKGGEPFGSHEIHEKLPVYLNRKKTANVTAFFVYNDLGAFVVSHILQEYGYRIPEDIAVVGFDNTFLALEMRPTLTSVAQPITEIGRLAIEMLLERIAGETPDEENMKVTLEPYLIVRESTRKIMIQE